MSFRLSAIFYVFAVVAASLATFGGWGLLVATAVVAFWAYIYWASPPSRTAQRLFGCLVVLVVLFLLVALLLPAVTDPREAARRNQCLNQMKQFAVALLAYDATFGNLPPAYVADADGKPILSWRVLVLPIIEEQPLYARFDLTKPWNDPANRPFSSVNLWFHHCPSASSLSPTTDYFAVIGPHTAWPEGRGRPLSEITDDPSQTIVLIEARGRGVNWAEPRDLSFDEAVDLLSQPFEPGSGHRIDPGFFYKPMSVLNVAFADGRASSIRGPIDRKHAEAMLTVDGGEEIDTSALEWTSEPEIDYAKCYVFGVFVVLAVLPVAWQRQRRKATALAEESEGAGEPSARG
jgi:hypothetical protein